MIRFTQSSALNDPFELRPFFEALFPDNWIVEQLDGKTIDVTEMFIEEYHKQPAEIKNKISLQRMLTLARAALAQPGAEHFASQVINRFMAAIKAATPAMRNTMWDELGKRLGMLSLSESPDSSTMWSYYADSHRGFVLGFDERHAFFNRRRSPNDEFFYLRQVVYGAPKEQRTLFDLNGTDFFLRKGEQWTHEREWRMLVPLPGDEVIGEGTGAIHLFRVPPESITSVIIGARADRAMTDELTVAARSRKFDHLIVQRAQLDDARQAITIVA